LFCIGTADAHKALSQYLLDKTKRDAFIEQYHLKNLSRDMTIKVSAKSSDKKLSFAVKLTNNSQELYHILDKQYNLGEMLLFESENGQYFQGLMYALPEYGKEIPKWIALKPGESREFNFDMDISPNTKEPNISKKYENFALILRTNDFVFFLDKPGKFKVYAMYESQPITKQLLAETFLKKVDFDNPWVGRAVSEPVSVIIP
jgi:hypothetical protein